MACAIFHLIYTPDLDELKYTQRDFFFYEKSIFERMIYTYNITLSFLGA